MNKELQRNLKGDDVMHNNQVRDYFRLHDRVSKRNVQFLNTLLTISLFVCSSIVTYILCIIGVIYLVYLVKIKEEEIDASKIIPFVFYMLFFVFMVLRDLQAYVPKWRLESMLLRNLQKQRKIPRKSALTT